MAASSGICVLQFADDINRKVEERAAVVSELKRTIVEAFTDAIKPTKEIPKCCPEGPLNLRNDPRFAFPVNRLRERF